MNPTNAYAASQLIHAYLKEDARIQPRLSRSVHFAKRIIRPLLSAWTERTTYL